MRGDSNHEISVIIPVYKDWERLSSCIDAIENQTIKLDLIELLIINNGPDFPPPKGFRLPSFARIIDEPKAGSYAARNLGVLESKGRFFAFTDSDCIPASFWLEEGIKILKNGADLVAGRITFFKAEESDSDLIFQFEQNFSFNQKRNVEEGKCGITANLFVTKEVLKTIGQFSESTYSGADTTWTKRATDRGFKIFYGEKVLVTHPSRSNRKDLYSKKRRTSGGFFDLEFKMLPLSKKILTVGRLLRPPVKVLVIANLSLASKIKLFLLKWSLELEGVRELIKLSASSGRAQRS